MQFIITINDMEAEQGEAGVAIKAEGQHQLSGDLINDLQTFSHAEIVSRLLGDVLSRFALDACAASAFLKIVSDTNSPLFLLKTKESAKKAYASVFSALVGNMLMVPKNISDIEAYQKSVASTIRMMELIKKDGIEQFQSIITGEGTGTHK